VPVVRRALAFRRAVAQRASLLAANSGNGGGSLQFELSARPPSYDTVMLLVRLSGPGGSRGAPIGLAVLNFGKQHSLRTPRCERPSRSPSPRQRQVMPSAVPGLPTLPWDLGDGTQLTEISGGHVKVDGSWHPRFIASRAAMQAPLDAARFFLVKAPLGDHCGSSKGFVLHYHTGWSAPHLHFGVRGKWTAAPGWPLRRASAPPSAGAPREGGRWWTVQVPLNDGGLGGIEFVLNDGGACWDHAFGGGNYKADGSGSYILEKGSLRRSELQS